MEIFTDGAARGNPGPSGIGFVFKSDGKIIAEHCYFIGKRTNNEAEYLAVRCLFHLSVPIDVRAGGNQHQDDGNERHRD